MFFKNRQNFSKISKNYQNFLKFFLNDLKSISEEINRTPEIKSHNIIETNFLKNIPHIKLQQLGTGYASLVPAVPQSSRFPIPISVSENHPRSTSKGDHPRGRRYTRRVTAIYRCTYTD